MTVDRANGKVMKHDGGGNVDAAATASAAIASAEAGCDAPSSYDEFEHWLASSSSPSREASGSGEKRADRPDGAAATEGDVRSSGAAGRIRPEDYDARIRRKLRRGEGGASSESGGDPDASAGGGTRAAAAASSLATETSLSKLDSFEAHIRKRMGELGDERGGDGGGWNPDDFLRSVTRSSSLDRFDDVAAAAASREASDDAKRGDDAGGTRQRSSSPDRSRGRGGNNNRNRRRGSSLGAAPVGLSRTRKLGDYEALLKRKMEEGKGGGGNSSSGARSISSTRSPNPDVRPRTKSGGSKDGRGGRSPAARTVQETLEEKIQKKNRRPPVARGEGSGPSPSAPGTSEEKIREESALSAAPPSAAARIDGSRPSPLALETFERKIQAKTRRGGDGGGEHDGSAELQASGRGEGAAETSSGRNAESTGRGNGSHEARSALVAFEEKIRSKKAGGDAPRRSDANGDGAGAAGLAPPVPSNVAPSSSADAARGATELRPPAPAFVSRSRFKDDDYVGGIRRKSAAATAAAAELRPPAPCDMSQSRFEDDDYVGGIRRKSAAAAAADSDRRPSAISKKISTIQEKMSTVSDSSATKVDRHASMELSWIESDFNRGDEEANFNDGGPNAIVQRLDSGLVIDSSARPVLRHSGETPHIPEAFLVESFVEDQYEAGEVVTATAVTFSEHKWKKMVYVMCCFVMLLVVGLSMALVGPGGKYRKDDDDASEAEEVGAGPDGLPAPPLSGEYCSPCIDRTAYTIKALVHGGESMVTKFSPSARQAAEDMGVNLELKLYTGRGRDERMSVDIISLATNRSSGVDALVVTVLSEAVSSAVRYAASVGMPVFGVETGIEHAQSVKTSSKTRTGLVEDGSMHFFTGMSDQAGGEMAASYFLKELSGANYTSALFISHLPPGVSDYPYRRRYKGYKERLGEATNDTIEVEWAEARPPIPEFAKEIVSDCKYQSVLVGTGKMLRAVVGALQDSGCYNTKVGSFDPDHVTPEMMENGRVDFLVDQFHSLQGWTAVQFAALYLTTGKVVSPPERGAYFSGPVLLTEDNYATSTALSKLSVCEGNAAGTDGECIDRKSVTIGGVVHGRTSDEFWDTVFSAAERGAVDMGVQLTLKQLESQESDEILYEAMAAEILGLCESGVDGLFVSIPNDGVADAVRDCREFNPNIQIVSINAGHERSKELDLIHHIGMDEQNAGYEAGKKMVRNVSLRKALCLNHEPGLIAMDDRCEGFERAMDEMGVEYLGQIAMREGDATFSSAAERAVSQSGGWEGCGMLLTGLSRLPAALELKKLHPGLMLGSFDADSFLYDSLEAGDVLFGVDQQPYLQGYLPVSILTSAVTTKQYFLDHTINTGPRFVFSPPTVKEADCEDRIFPVCSMEGG